jgi:hypothetical protein
MLAMTVALLSSSCHGDAPADSEAVPSSSVDREASPERPRRLRTLREARTVRSSAAASARRRVRELARQIDSGLQAGSSHTCRLDDDGTVTCWGDNSGDVRCNGREAGGQTEAPDGEFTDLAAGGSHTCATEAETGRTLCWGDSLYGEAAPPDGKYLSSAESDRSGNLPKMGSH